MPSAHDTFITSQIVTLVIHILRPVMTSSSPSGTTRVLTLRGSEPMSGSVVPVQQILRPAIRSGRKRSRFAPVVSDQMRAIVHSCDSSEIEITGGSCSNIRP